MSFLDTNIVSEMCRDRNVAGAKGHRISSVVAMELLLTSSTSATSARYYIPMPSAAILNGLHCPLAGKNVRVGRRDHAYGKSSTDSMVTDFAGDFGSIVMFGNKAISATIGDKRGDLLRSAASFLPKATRSVIEERFRFLVESEMECVAVSDPNIHVAMDLLWEFSRKYTLKASFRNSWHDLLILAVALCNGDQLVTEDSLLAKFAAEVPGVNLVSHAKSVVLCPERRILAASSPTERQAYVNRGWKVREQNARKLKR